MSPIDALAPTVTLLAAGTAAVLVSRAVKVSPIVGYLVAGLFIGPHALGLVPDSDTTHLLAELGVVFLLFDIGMHISMRELKESRSDLAGLAPSHMLLTGAVFAGGLGLIGVDWPVAIAVGVSLALSSTAVVARILSDRDLRSCPLGRSAVNVLIFQDICAIFLLIYASSLSSGAERVGLVMAIAAAQALVAFFAALLAGRYVVTPVFRALAATRNEEVFTAFVLLLALGAACATQIAGLSLTLGAFLAGLAVSGTPFRHQVQTETAPFRGLLLSFFFINVGMMIDIREIAANWALIFAAAAAIILIKTGLGFIAARLNKWSGPGGVQLAFLLAQGSEFTLVVFSIAAVTAQLPPRVETTVVSAVALSLAAAPFWAGLGLKIARRLAARSRKETPDQTTTVARPVLIYGMTAAGRLAIDALEDHDVPYLALDNDPDRFMAAVADGYKVSFGDAANLKLVDAIGASHARAVVVGAPRYEISESITPAVNRLYPGMERFIAVETPQDLARFSALGIRAHLAKVQPKGVEMVADLLRHVGVDDKRISAWLTAESERFDLDDVTKDVLATKPAEAA